MVFLNISVRLSTDLEILQHVLKALYFAVGCVGRCVSYLRISGHNSKV